MKGWDRIGLVVLILAVFAVSYQGRTDQRDSQLAGCARGKLDRAANAKAWRQAEKARRRDGDLDVAAIYADVASDLEMRSRIVCAEAFPAPKLLPFL